MTESDLGFLKHSDANMLSYFQAREEAKVEIQQRFNTLSGVDFEEQVRQLIGDAWNQLLITQDLGSISYFDAAGDVIHEMLSKHTESGKANDLYLQLIVVSLLYRSKAEIHNLTGQSFGNSQGISCGHLREVVAVVERNRNLFEPDKINVVNAVSGMHAETFFYSHPPVVSLGGTN